MQKNGKGKEKYLEEKSAGQKSFQNPLGLAAVHSRGYQPGLVLKSQETGHRHTHGDTPAQLSTFVFVCG